MVEPLVEARFKIRKQAMEYNTSWPATRDDAKRDRLRRLRDMLGRFDGEDGHIEPPLQLDYGCNVSIGKRFYSNFNLCILDCALVTIGDRVMCGPNVSFFTATHETEVQSRRDYIEYALPITIGDDCWIGGHVVVLPGVTIGKGCTIAAGAVVTKDIPDWSVAMGQPAKVVKKVTPVDDVKE